MHFEGAFRLPGRPEEVIERFTDVERMARCVPGATLEGRDPEGDYVGAIVVAFGPKRIRFRGKVACNFDIPARSGTLHGRGMADMRKARFEVRTTFTVIDDPDAGGNAPVSLVTISSDAQLGGVLSAFAGAGGTAVGNVLMQEFARNLAREYGEEHRLDDVEKPADGTDNAVSARRVVWSAVKDKASRALPRRRKSAPREAKET